LVVGSTESAYARALQDQYASEQVHFVGKQLDVRPYLAVADVFVLPTLSIGEGLPVALLEAMSSKRIAIGSNVSGIKDVLKPFNQCLFPPNDSKALSVLLQQFISLPAAARAELAQQMRQYVETELSLAQFVKAHDDLYQKLRYL